MQNRITSGSVASFSLALLALLFQHAAVIATELELEYFAKHPDYRYAEISPDGKHVAVSLIQSDQIIMAVINRDSMKATAGARPQLGASVSDFYAINPVVSECG